MSDTAAPKECEACAFWTREANGRPMRCPDHLAALEGALRFIKLEFPSVWNHEEFKPEWRALLGGKRG